MNPEEKLAWQGNIHFYNSLSEFYLYQDLYSLSSMMQSMLSTRYGESAKKIIELIHSDNEKLITEGEVKIIKDNISFLERDYSDTDPNQLFMYYKNNGYQIDDLEPDHLGVELKFITLLSLETMDKDNIVGGAAKELRFLNNRFLWLPYLFKRLVDDKRDPRLTKEVVGLTMNYIDEHKAFLTSCLKDDAKNFVE